MSNRLDCYVEFKKFEVPLSVRIGNGINMFGITQGNINLSMLMGNHLKKYL